MCRHAIQSEGSVTFYAFIRSGACACRSVANSVTLDTAIRIVDPVSAYCRLSANEEEPSELYALLKHVLRLPERPL